MFCKMFVFFFTDFSQGNFLFCQNFLILMKTLHTAYRSKTKPVACNFFVKIFVSFIIKHQPRRG